MIGDASSSNPPSPSTLLAPGFRFHPTDEELVSYYLKRKISARPIRVDAIAEVDLYKFEPWDLPSKSLLRSRDMEWYFFSPLDRKYSNRSRTNRATAGGYWKTTGKDRPIRHGPQIAGMKKTLVFHVGRAPRGERTNWVMHEYRLEDDDLACSRILQDAFVVCRIFQKCGSGPQNGAQYGAPFVEEEWEGAEDNFVPVRDDGVDALVDAGDLEYMQLTDFEQTGDGRLWFESQGRSRLLSNHLLYHAGDGRLELESQGRSRWLEFGRPIYSGALNQDPGNQPESTGPLRAGSDEQDGGSHPEDPTILLDEIHKDQSFIDDINGYINVSGLQDSPTRTNDMVENTGIAEESHSPPNQNDGFVELNDIFDNANVDYPTCENPVDCLLRASHDQFSMNGMDETINLPEVEDIEFYNTTNEGADPSELVLMRPPIEGDFYLQSEDLLNLVDGDSPTGQSYEDSMVFHDAPDLPFTQDDLPDTNELLFSPVADLSGFDMVDNLMAYFDATDNNLHYATLNSSEMQEFADSSTWALSTPEPEVDGSGNPTFKAILQASEANIERGASSSARLSEADNKLKVINQDVTAVPDVQSNDGWDKTFTKSLVNILGSISAPPALAEEFPTGEGKFVGQISATHSSSSIHVTAGMIQIHGLTVTGRAEHWALQKNGGMSVLLSYGMADNVVSNKSVCYEPITKMQGGALSSVFRGGFYLFCLSMLILTVSIKVGMHVYNR